MKIKKKVLGNIIFVIAMIIILYVLFYNPAEKTDQDTIECLAKKSTVYVQLGCSACDAQEETFGKENWAKLNVVDCFFEQEKCQGITSTPTWIINGEQHIGAKSIAQLKDIAEC